MWEEFTCAFRVQVKQVNHNHPQWKLKGLKDGNMSHRWLEEAGLRPKVNSWLTGDGRGQKIMSETSRCTKTLRPEQTSNTLGRRGLTAQVSHMRLITVERWNKKGHNRIEDLQNKTGNKVEPTALKHTLKQMISVVFIYAANEAELRTSFFFFFFF